MTAPKSGTQVLRARQRRWTAGQTTSAGSSRSPPTSPPPRTRAVTAPRTTALRPSSPPRSSQRPTASERFHWGAKLYDYAWEGGQSLDSPPSKGDVRDGRWHATSDGTGRVIPFDGGWCSRASSSGCGPGDRGALAATLTVRPAHGRWEFRLQGRPWETGARPYRFRLELVPGRGGRAPAVRRRAIVLADFTMGSARDAVRSAVPQSAARCGVRILPSRSAWPRTPSTSPSRSARSHITWFLDGNPIGTVTDAGRAARRRAGAAAQPGRLPGRR